jgi:hypothetical protein
VLQEYGRHGVEGILLWAGVWGIGGEELITTLILPDQENTYGRAVITRAGLLRVSEIVREKDLFIMAQVHTHPRQAFHSSGDDEGAIGYYRGFLSLVIPSFAAGDPELYRCAAYRYQAGGQWQEIPPDRLPDHIAVVPEFVDARR